MNVGDPNVPVVEMVVNAIGSLRDEFVLVGGCSVGLLITDTARPPVRQTVDVDMVVQVATKADYYKTADRLKACGFKEAPEEQNICRWKRGGLILDVLPTDQNVLGHSTNKWYPAAVQTAETIKLPSGNYVRIISAPLFVATKFEAFHSRGDGDYLRHDMEDIVNVVDGRSELPAEVAACNEDTRTYLREEFEILILDEAFLDLLPAHFGTDAASQARVPIVVDRMRRLAGY